MFVCVGWGRGGAGVIAAGGGAPYLIGSTTEENQRLTIRVHVAAMLLTASNDLVTFCRILLLRPSRDFEQPAYMLPN